MNPQDLSHYYSCSNGAPAVRWRLEQGSNDGTPFDSCGVVKASANVSAGAEVGYMFLETTVMVLLFAFIIAIFLVHVPHKTLDRWVMGR